MGRSAGDEEFRRPGEKYCGYGYFYYTEEEFCEQASHSFPLFSKTKLSFIKESCVSICTVLYLFLPEL